MDEIDMAVLDMSAFEFSVECHDAYKHKGDGVSMHSGPTAATHAVRATCGHCGAQTEETNVCLKFIEEAYGSQIKRWRCAQCRALNRYDTTLEIITVYSI